jgi:predicted amidophosphoribosyltransferase
VLQELRDPPLSACPECGAPIRKLISWCRAAVTETSEETLRVKSQIRNHEKEGRWSHAAELADKHAERTHDRTLRMRALENYEKAGYDAGTLSHHANDE